LRHWNFEIGIYFGFGVAFTVVQLKGLVDGGFTDDGIRAVKNSIRKGVINEVDDHLFPKIAKYGENWVGDAFDEDIAGIHTVKKMCESPATDIKIYDYPNNPQTLKATVTETMVIKKGEHYFDPIEQKWHGFGYEHLTQPRGALPSRTQDIINKFPGVENSDDVLDKIGNTAENPTRSFCPTSGDYVGTTVLEKYYYGEGYLSVIVNSDGSFQTAIPRKV
jgi:hypothetical protein